MAGKRAFVWYRMALHGVYDEELAITCMGNKITTQKQYGDMDNVSQSGLNNGLDISLAAAG